MSCFQALKTKKALVKESNANQAERLSRLQKEYNDKDSESNQLTAKITESNTNIKDLNSQKNKIFSLMDNEWNEDSQPSVDEFMERIAMFRSKIVEITDHIENERQEILNLNQELKSIEKRERDRKVEKIRDNSEDAQRPGQVGERKN